jgi:Ca2+-binding RTX toxin-like protein
MPVSIRPDFDVDSAPSGIASQSNLVSLPGGGFLALWSSYEGAPSGNNVSARIYSANGQPAGSVFIVNSTTEGDQGDPFAIVLPDGRTLVTWTAQGEIYARLLASDGTLVGNDFLLSTFPVSVAREQNTAMLADGGFVVTRVSLESGPSGYDIRAQIFDPNGARRSADFVVNTTTDLQQGLPVVTTFAEGRMLFAWYSNEYGGTDRDIRARIFNADGTPAGDDFIVNTTTAGAQLDVSVATLADGRIAISWTSAVDFNIASDIRATIIDPSIYEGTNQDDYWSGGERTDTMTGRNGNDVFRGNGGDDSIAGGRGADSLQGGSGDDKLSGQAGDDAIDGGKGADQLSGGDGADMFIYTSLSDGGDRILGFDKYDSFVFERDALGIALPSGSLEEVHFRTGKSNEARDADDHFIFRTTDGTLWFDADGSGANSAVLIADLSNSFKITAEDILIA